jgi:hypothetical protein
MQLHPRRDAGCLADRSPPQGFAPSQELCNLLQPLAGSCLTGSLLGKASDPEMVIDSGHTTRCPPRRVQPSARENPSPSVAGTLLGRGRQAETPVVEG